MFGKVNRRSLIKGAGAAGVLGMSSVIAAGAGTSTAAAGTATLIGTWEVDITGSSKLTGMPLPSDYFA